MQTQRHILAPQRKFSQLPTAQKVEAITGWLLDKKGLDLLALDLAGEQHLCEAVILVTASSPRHAKGLADFVLDEARKGQFEFLRMEGYTIAQWILMDLNDVVIHIFQPEARDLYCLDDLWPAASILADYRKEI